MNKEITEASWKGVCQKEQPLYEVKKSFQNNKSETKKEIMHTKCLWDLRQESALYNLLEKTYPIGITQVAKASKIVTCEPSP